jgi:hypothetical protein
LIAAILQIKTPVTRLIAIDSAIAAHDHVYTPDLRAIPAG